MFCHTTKVNARIEAIVAKLDKKGNIVSQNPDFIKQGDAALVEVVPEIPVCIEAFSDYPPFGRILMRDTSSASCSTLIIGVVKNVIKEGNDDFYPFF